MAGSSTDDDEQVAALDGLDHESTETWEVTLDQPITAGLASCQVTPSPSATLGQARWGASTLLVRGGQRALDG